MKRRERSLHIYVIKTGRLDTGALIASIRNCVNISELFLDPLRSFTSEHITKTSLRWRRSQLKYIVYLAFRVTRLSLLGTFHWINLGVFRAMDGSDWIISWGKSPNGIWADSVRHEYTFRLVTKEIANTFSTSPDIWFNIKSVAHRIRCEIQSGILGLIVSWLR